MPLPSFDVSWTAAGASYRFVSPGTLTLPSRPALVLPVEAWLALRDVLHLLGPAQPAEHLDGTERLLPSPPRSGPANQGKPWLEEDETRVRDAWSAGDDTADIARAIGRTRGSVLARLVRMGLIDEAQAGLRYPAAPPPAPPPPPVPFE